MLEHKITGMMVYYYVVCKRKLWLFCNDISMENDNEMVKIGKFLDESSYMTQRKHICINDEINIDFVENKGIIHEIKKSRSIEEASIWQVKYYLYYLREHGMKAVKAKLDYPLLKKTVEVELSDADVTALKGFTEEIRYIAESGKIPPVKEKKTGICKKCAFYDLCMI